MSTDIVPFVRRDMAVTVSASFLEARDGCLAVAALIGGVTSSAENAIAADTLREISALRRGAEKAHKEIKAPVIKCGRDLDAALKSAIEPLQSEEIRLSRMCGDYVQLQEAKVRAHAAAIAARERNEQAELQDRLAKATSIDEHQAIREEAAVLAQTAPLVPFAPVRVEGQQLREVWEIKVTDVLELAAWALKSNLPHLVDITPRNTAIGALLDRGVVIPGVEGKKVAKVLMR